MTPQEAFLIEYEEICKRHKLIIDACGCCNSPWVVPLDENITYSHFDHLKDSYPDNSKVERTNG